MASSGDPAVFGEARTRPEIGRVHDWVPEGMELRFAFLVHIRRDQYIPNARNKKKFQGGFDYLLPMACNWSFRQFGEHKEKENFHVRLQIDVLERAFGPRMAGAPSRAEPCRRNGSSSQNSSVSARQRGGSTSMGTNRRIPLEVEPDYNSGVDEEKLYSDVIQNLRRAPRAENQDEADNNVRVEDDAVGEDEDLVAIEWDPLNPHMEEGSVLSSMSECRNALVTYCIKAERTFKVDKSYQVRYRVHCPTEGCPL
uniref:Transposase MuDR plant domain-containing protein n=1 Tax=Aegilops tauschii TaxID=37682 RepID=M8CZK5_AEGTA